MADVPPPVVFDPPFNITRASHVVLNVADLDASRFFYEEVIGLVVSAAEADAVYLRGVEEACHHSLVLRRSAAPSCSRIGLRIVNEDHLRRAHDIFAEMGCTVAWADAPYQGPTLHVIDPVGTPLEFCALMDAMPRMITRFSRHRGGGAGRLDHYQILTPEVGKALTFYSALGFRLSEYIMPPDESLLAGVFLQRKGNPHDIVFFNGTGPRLHHFAFTAAEGANMLRACDIAGELGFGQKVERGPGRHGPGHAMFVYFRDPDGHRVELFNTHYQVMDLENEPVRWDPADPNISFPWGLPAQHRWFTEATRFEGVCPVDPGTPPNPLSLERFLAARDRG